MFALNKGRCYFYHSIAAGGGWRGGVGTSLRDSPALRWYTASGPSQGRAPKLHWSDSNCSTLSGGSYGVHGDYISYPVFYFTSLAGAAIYFSCCHRCWALIRVRWNDDDSFSVLLVGLPPPFAPIVLPLRGDELAPAYAGDREHMPCDKQC